MRDGCVFCDYSGPNPILHEEGYGYAHDEDGVFVIEPIDPVVPGHVLVIPHVHAADFRDDAAGLSLATQVAAEWAKEHVDAPGCNIIVSAGAEATQFERGIPHIHVHVIPRYEGDGLKLPWSP